MFPGTINFAKMPVFTTVELANNFPRRLQNSPRNVSTCLWDTHGHLGTMDSKANTIVSHLLVNLLSYTNFKEHTFHLQTACGKPLVLPLDFSISVPTITQNTKLPHRTSLQVLPLLEEESGRLGPVNYGCETFRPP